ncbi:hypothetical protein [Paracraurococcus lichenis]|uniref:Flagellar protein FlbD n=1 Tax=Paracraurococcus lichenis TaxID=3064888 RepID=A0ABT9E8I2_9PROT|nr:hypothetical protein [Paracraurococcus sp. LOR1-02]MDO9712488.1 hypothetical protein [Paracraurococcus sp. LOR1-02]
MLAAFLQLTEGSQSRRTVVINVSQIRSLKARGVGNTSVEVGSGKALVVNESVAQIVDMLRGVKEVEVLGTTEAGRST